MLLEGILLNKVSFDLDTSMNDPCITREQSSGIHNVVNDQGFAMHYRVISNTASHLEIFRCQSINTAQQKDGLTSFLMLSVLEAKIFQYDFWKDIMSEKITVIDRQHREM